MSSHRDVTSKNILALAVIGVISGAVGIALNSVGDAPCSRRKAFAN